ncbi:hypothetical protein RvY_07413-1 [Ramazzottius varieornatus]|uniref:Receptor ligand binding region domain-containing protein n=1 Tax=Ramazzottius varieornatus TaxID=947166 RepID=A0A1D1V226_RAMVA|nr:hypothetical protein RvY_07413-1 [Ramazzottius varieornatus]
MDIPLLMVFFALICGKLEFKILKRRTVSLNLTVCWLLEDDSYYSTYERLAAAVDLAIEHSNSYILPEHIKLQLVFQSAGPSCSNTQYSVAANVMQLVRDGVECNVFLGITCPTTAISLYGIAENLNTPVLGCPAAGTAALLLNPRSLSGTLPLLIKASFGFVDIRAFTFSFLRENGYRHLSILRDESATFYSLMGKFFTLRTRNDTQYGMDVQEFPFFNEETSLPNFKKLLKIADDVSRVFLVLGHADFVRKTLVCET